MSAFHVNEEVADRVSSEVTDAVNKEIDKGCPVSVLAGLCLGLLNFMRTAPQEVAPPEFKRLLKATTDVLDSLGWDDGHGETMQ